MSVFPRRRTSAPICIFLSSMRPSRTSINCTASLVSRRHRVLSHCGMGLNRSALVAGLTLHKLGMSGPEVVTRLRARRPGALFNPQFATFLEGV